MKRIVTASAVAFSLALAACGGTGDDTLGDRAEDAAENKADAMEEAADNLSGPAEDRLEEQAEQVRDAGEAREEAIDDSDVDVRTLNQSQQDALVNAR